MSAIGGKAEADIAATHTNVRFWGKGDIDHVAEAIEGVFALGDLLLRLGQCFVHIHGSDITHDRNKRISDYEGIKQPPTPDAA
jgi:hypothetical protein